MITSPPDEQFITDPNLHGHISEAAIRIRAKVWFATPVERVTATLASLTFPLINIPGSRVWECLVDRTSLPDGVYDLAVTAGDETNIIRIVLGRSAYIPPQRAAQDQDTAFEAWPERGLLATQLGPNKNGKEW